MERSSVYIAWVQIIHNNDHCQDQLLFKKDIVAVHETPDIANASSAGIQKPAEPLFMHLIEWRKFANPRGASTATSCTSWWRPQMETCFRITGPLCGEFTGHRWISFTKASDAGLWYFHWYVHEKNVWVNNREAGDLRHHRAHYDVIVMLWHDATISDGTYCVLHVYWSREPGVCFYCRSAVCDVWRWKGTLWF